MASGFFAEAGEDAVAGVDAVKQEREVRPVWFIRITGSRPMGKAEGRAELSHDGKTIVALDTELDYQPTLRTWEVAGVLEAEPERPPGWKYPGRRYPWNEKQIAHGAINSFTLSPDDVLLYNVSGPIATGRHRAELPDTVVGMPRPKEYCLHLTGLRSPEIQAKWDGKIDGAPMPDQDVYYVGSTDPGKYMLLMINKEGNVTVNGHPVRVASDRLRVPLKVISTMHSRQESVSVSPSMTRVALVCDNDVFVMAQYAEGETAWEATNIDVFGILYDNTKTVERWFVQKWQAEHKRGQRLGVRYGRSDDELIVYGPAGLVVINPTTRAVIQFIQRGGVTAAAVSRTSGHLVVGFNRDGRHDNLSIYDINRQLDGGQPEKEWRLLSSIMDYGRDDTPSSRETSAIHIDVSPDGRVILVCTASREVQLYEAESGRREVRRSLVKGLGKGELTEQVMESAPPPDWPLQFDGRR